MLDIQRRNHVDVGGQQFLHVFIALAMLASGNIGVRQFVDQYHRRATRQNRVDIHLFKDGALIFHLLSWHDFHPRDQLLDPFAAVRLNHADDDVLAAAAAPDRFAQHAERLAHTRRITQKQLKNATRFLRAGEATSSHSSGFFGTCYVLRCR